MKAIIIEDEPLAAERLKSLIGKLDAAIEVAAKLDSIDASVRWLMQWHADLIFMDIHLSDGLGFRIFERVVVNTPVIFTTAYDQYAIKAFKVNAVDYLLKPIDERELAAALNKFRLAQNKQPDWEQLIKSYWKQPEYQKRFLVNAGQKIRSIEVSEVAYCYAEEKIVIMQTKSAGAKFPLDYTLDKLEAVLDPEIFFRINRKVIVQLHSIRNMTAYSKSRILLELQPPPDFETIVSIDRAAEFKRWLNR